MCYIITTLKSQQNGHRISYGIYKLFTFVIKNKKLNSDRNDNVDEWVRGEKHTPDQVEDFAWRQSFLWYKQAHDSILHQAYSWGGERSKLV